MSRSRCDLPLMFMTWQRCRTRSRSVVVMTSSPARISGPSLTDLLVVMRTLSR